MRKVPELAALRKVDCAHTRFDPSAQCHCGTMRSVPGKPASELFARLMRNLKCEEQRHEQRHEQRSLSQSASHLLPAIRSGAPRRDRGHSAGACSWAPSAFIIFICAAPGWAFSTAASSGPASPRSSALSSASSWPGRVREFNAIQAAAIAASLGIPVPGVGAAAPQCDRTAAHPTRTVVACPRCNTANPAGSRFCSACGNAL